MPFKKLADLFKSKQRPFYNLKVVDVAMDKNGEFVDLWIEKPKDMQFPVLSGVGIAGSLGQQDLKDIQSLLKDSSKDDLQKLVPHNGVAGPEFTAPSDAFLSLLLNKAVLYAQHTDKSHKQTQQQQLISKRAALLAQVINNAQKKEHLQANYTVMALLRLFPNIISAQDILNTQPKEHGNKTYTVDARQIMKRGGVDCFRLNVGPENGEAYCALFGEDDPICEKAGFTSSYLRGLKPGDTLMVNAKVKAPAFMAELDDPNKHIIFVAQGNAMIKSLGLLEYIRHKRKNGHQTAQVSIIGAFKTEDAIQELEHLKDYASDGTANHVNFALSRESKARPTKTLNGVSFHYGVRPQDILDRIKCDSIQEPYFFICGSTPFCQGAKSVAQAASDLLKEHSILQADNEKMRFIKTSSSPNRYHPKQGLAPPSMK